MRQHDPVRQDGVAPSSPTRNLNHQVEEFLQQRVLRGDWPAGHKLPSEAELGKQFQASRTVIREAIRRLQGRGLLKTINGSGTYVSAGRLEDVSFALNAYSVRASDQQSFSDLLDLRMALEGDAAAKVAASIDAVDWRRLDARLEVMAATRILEEFAIHDIDFHMDVLRLSGNELFASLGSALRDRYVKFAILRFAVDSYRDAESLRKQTMDEHRLIVDAIARGDVDGARQAARAHVDRSRGRWVDSDPSVVVIAPNAAWSEK
jgi:GntR family transcriptional repressor for pyruvate dehydrogenase complex